MVSLTIHEVVFIEIDRLNSAVCTVYEPVPTKEAFLGGVGMFDHSFSVLFEPNDERVLMAYQSLYHRSYS